MAYKNYLNHTVEFKNVGGINIPTKPWPQMFYVSRELFDMLTFEIRPLTVMGLIKGVGKNFVTMNYWRMTYLFSKCGFLDVPEGEIMRWKYWRWNFLAVREKRQRQAWHRKEVSLSEERLRGWNTELNLHIETAKMLRNTRELLYQTNNALRELSQRVPVVDVAELLKKNDAEFE